MNKAKAKKIALESTPSWGELKEMILKSDISGVSKVNRSLSRAYIQQMFLTFLESKDLSETPKTISFSVNADKNTINRDGMSIVNMLREFG